MSENPASPDLKTGDNSIRARMDLNQDCLAEFCHRWRIKELSLFGSILRSSYHRDSDIDILVSFFDDASWGLFEHQIMEEELSLMLGKKVDLVTRRAIERSSNWIRRQAILADSQLYYVAR